MNKDTAVKHLESAGVNLKYVLEGMDKMNPAYWDVYDAIKYNKRAISTIKKMAS